MTGLTDLDDGPGLPSSAPDGEGRAEGEPDPASGADPRPPSPYAPTMQQLDVVHLALFGWPMDHLTPVDRLRASPDVTAAARILLNSTRYRWDARGMVPLWPTDKWVCTDAWGLRIWVNLRDGHVGWGVLHEDWENDEVAFLLRHLQPGDRFVDVGANVGVYTLQAARAVGPSGHVYSIEPRSDTCQMLARSIGDNGFAGRCTVFNVALGSGEARGALNTGHDPLNPGATFIRTDEDGGVRICPLDSLPIPDGPRVKVLKMDIEGFEPVMMDGARSFFAKHRPTVMTEIFPRSIREVAGRDACEYFDQFTALGYGVHHLDKDRAGARMERTDIDAIADTADPVNVVCLPE